MNAAGTEAGRPADEGIACLVAQLAERREALGWKRPLVAARMGSTSSVLSALERSARVPQIPTLRHWAHALGMELQLVLAGGEEACAGLRLLARPGHRLVEGDEDVLAIMRALTERRYELGISRTLVAARMDSTEGVVGELERCAKAPKVATLSRWASALGYRLELALAELSERERGCLRLAI